MGEEPTARRGVARFLREAAGEYTATGRPRGCLMLSAAANCSSAEVVEVLRRRRAANVREMRRRIQADADAGVLPASTDAGALARYTAVVIQGMSQQARDGASRAALEEVAELAMQAWPEDASAS